MQIKTKSNNRQYPDQSGPNWFLRPINKSLTHRHQFSHSLSSRYEQDNGQIVSAAGALKTVVGPDGPQQALVISGAYTFVGTDGITYWVNYTADENGFHPVVGTGPGGIGPGQDSSIDPNALKSLIG